MTEHDIEERARAELKMIERFERISDDGGSIDPAELSLALNDGGEALRATALDYLATSAPSDLSTGDVMGLASREKEIQCLGRLVYLSHIWNNKFIAEAINWRLTPAEAEYINLWDAAGRLTSSADVSAAVILVNAYRYGDWELKELSGNLMEDIVEANPKIAAMLTLISNAFENILVGVSDSA